MRSGHLACMWLAVVVMATPRLLLAQAEIDILISDSGRNRAWTSALDKSPGDVGWTFAAPGRDGRSVGGILISTTALQQLLVVMPCDETLANHATASPTGSPTYTRQLYERIVQHVIPAQANGVPVFEIRLLEHADPDEPSDRQAARLKTFMPEAYAAVGRVIEYFQKERGVRVRITAALADTGAEGFALALQAWRPYAASFRRVDIVDGRASLAQARTMIDVLEPRRVRIFNTAGAECPAMTVGRQETVDRLLSDYPGLTQYRFSMHRTAASNQPVLPVWHEGLAGQSLAQVERRRNSGSEVITTKLADPLAPQQFRPPEAGWDPIGYSAIAALALESVSAAKVEQNLADLRDAYAPRPPEQMSITRAVPTAQEADDYGRAIEQIKIDPNGSYSIYKWNNSFNSDRPNSTFLSHSGLAVVDNKSNRVLYTLSYTNERGGSYEHPLKDQNMRGAQAAIDRFRSKGEWTAKLEAVGDGSMVGNLRDAYLSRASNPPRYQLTALGNRENCKTEMNNLVRDTFSQSTPQSGAPALSSMRADYSESLRARGPSLFKDASATPLSDTFGAGRGFAAVPFRQGSAERLPAFDNLRAVSTPNVKGVLLQAVAQFEGNSGRLHAQNVGLVFQDAGGGIDVDRLRKFTTALWAAYLSVEGPGISIDPIEKNTELNPVHRVRYIGQVEHTDVGRVMRETDYIMKQWAVGTVRPDIPDFLNPDDLDSGEQRGVYNRPSRFWIVPENLTFRHSGSMLLFASGNMRVFTEYLDNNPKGEVNLANEKFAQWFTRQYHNQIALRYPVFQHLFDYAQLTSLGTFLRESQVPMLWFLVANREMILAEKSVKEVPALVLQSGRRWYVQIHGGVDMKTDKALRNPDSYTADPKLSFAHDVAAAAGPADADAVRFRVDADRYAAASSRSMALSASTAMGDTVQTDVALWRTYQHPAGEKVWKLATPGLELVRHFNPTLRSRAEFGGGWHVMVPYRLEDESARGPLLPRGLPTKIAVVNQLSGVRDVLKRTSDATTYEPVDPDSGLAERLVRAAGGWRLTDRLGCTMDFDPEGDLVQMHWRAPAEVSVKGPNGTRFRQGVEGYVVEYRYSPGGEGIPKLLRELRQGTEIARIAWTAGARRQISRIEVARASSTAALVEYKYAADGRLTSVVPSNGPSSTIMYSDASGRLSVRQVYGTVK